jgi:RNA polymerase sigma-70 factor (ECF subfamily)
MPEMGYFQFSRRILPTSDNKFARQMDRSLPRVPMMEPEADEQSLRDAVLAGDQAAWRSLYDRAYGELWRYIVWRCAGARQRAEEITQETWLVAVRRIADFNPQQASFLTWLRGIAANVLRNHLRTRRAQPGAVMEPEYEESQRRDEAELIAAALAELPERYEAALRAKYLSMQSVDEIAKEWQVSPKTVESLLTRAREAFRLAYEKLAGMDEHVKEGLP